MFGPKYTLKKSHDSTIEILHLQRGNLISEWYGIHRSFREIVDGGRYIVGVLPK